VARLAPLYTWRTAITESDLPPGARHVALTISLYLTEKQAVAWPSQKTLAKDTGMGERSVRRHLAVLEETGFIRREKRSGTSDLLYPDTPAKLAAPPRPDLPHPPATVADEVSIEEGSGSEEPSREVEYQHPGPQMNHAHTRPRDLLWDVFDEELAPAVTKNERGRRNAALKQIREALGPDALISDGADELRARIARYRVRFPAVACTETAIASHWSSLAGPNGRPSSPPCPECEMGSGLHAADCPRVDKTIPSVDFT